MSTSKITRAVHNLFRQINRMARTLTKGLISSLLRGLLVLGGRPLASIAGFILPTTVLLLLVVTLTVGAIGYRTYTRSQQTIGERQQRVIYNAATPAIDRAKAKLEFMFNQRRDARFGGVPAEDFLMGMMLNDGSYGVARYPANGPDPYTFPDETRLNIGGRDTRKDNAWRYRIDLNGDGTIDASGAGSRDGTVVYSILFDAPDVSIPAERSLTLRDSTDTAVRQRADRLMIRNAPLSNAAATNNACIRGDADAGAAVPLISERGWFDDPIDSTKLRKNFQVNAYVVPDNGNTTATIEFQQDREAIQGFKWAAWFRNDIEIFPGPQFNWNGAMHTEGSYFLSGNFRAFMVSAPASCLYKEDASTLTTPFTQSTRADRPNFQGQFVTGTIRDNRFAGSPKFDLWRGEGQLPDRGDDGLGVVMSSSADSITNRANDGPLEVSLDPVRLQTEDVSAGRTVQNPGDRRTTTWANSNLASRMVNQAVAIPYLDDLFRADNRYGPKPTFGYSRSDIPTVIGEEIGDNIELVGEDAASEDSQNVGLDGYWERRAQNEGARFIVGQRLELGDPMGWGGPVDPNGRDPVATLENEPLRPWPENCNGNSCAEQRQRRNQWDNLAAVQSTAIYHSASPDGKKFPAACMVTTIHPGTAVTLDKSATFEDLAFGFNSAFAAPYNQQGRVITDFFRGRGTNSWQFSIPEERNFSLSTSPLMVALHNLAYFAGDPNGGAPSFTPTEDGFVHPYPAMSMWGDFSLLRKVLEKLDTGASTYARLSPADKTTLHTSACMLGMLAYNLDYLDKFDLNSASLSSVIGSRATAIPTAPAITDPYWQGLRGHIRAIDALIYDADRNTSNTRTSLNTNDKGDPVEVPSALRSTIPSEIGDLQTADMESMAWQQVNSNDPETYVRLLEAWRDNTTDTTLKDQLTKSVYLAQMIITQQQVARDRQFGFRGKYGSSGRDDVFSRQCNTWQRELNSDSNANYKIGAQKEPLFRLCSARPRYPVLYSLFPIPDDGATSADHGDVASSDNNVTDRVRDTSDNVNPNRRYFRLINGSDNIYKQVSPADVRTLPLRLGNTGVGFLSSEIPSSPAQQSTNWRVPFEVAANGTTPNSNQFDLIKVCGGADLTTGACSRQTSLTDRKPISAPRYRIAVKDGAFMNGRELLSVRTLDLDIELLRTSTFANNYWLPKSGIIYSFREDAISEAQIVRPAANSWDNCGNETSLRTRSNCQMQSGRGVSAEDSTDPPLSPKKITPKPVDYFPDPERRPNGFRLRNGASVWRGSVVGSEIRDDANPAGRGMSFITDNPAYIQGPFNLHRAPGVTSTSRRDALEEFTQKLNTEDFNNDGTETVGTESYPVYAFYNRTDLNLNFSDRRFDQWRPSELLADAVTPLSTNFCDGSIEDGAITTDGVSSLSTSLASERYGCVRHDGTALRVTSYLNQNRRNASMGNGNSLIRGSVVDTYWSLRVGGNRIPGGDQDASNSPVYFNRMGKPLSTNSSGNITDYNGGYRNMDESKPRITTPPGIQMNLIMVSGLVPSREGQSYGGLHNFPRFIENWNSKEFFISGAFLQLNFSNYATAPFDQEQWEPALSEPNRGADNNEWIAYYEPPYRRWGFDVGLKYAPPGPVAERFRTPDPARSEFYSEPPADDPYIQKLASCVAQNSCQGS